MLGLMSGPGLFAVVVTGLVAGALARALIGGERSMFGALLIGLAGALLGVAGASLLGLPMKGLAAFSLASLAGATGLLAIGALFARR